MKQIKNLLLVIVILMITVQFSLAIYGNGETGDEVLNPTNTDWILYKEISGVQIYYRVEDCHDIANGIHKQFVTLQFINTTEYDLKIQWTNKLWFDDICRTCNNPDEYTFKIGLPGGDAKIGSCDNDTSPKLRFFSKFLNYDQYETLSKFQLDNIIVEPR